jgi:hypothetical protein
MGAEIGTIVIIGATTTTVTGDAGQGPGASGRA